MVYLQKNAKIGVKQLKYMCTRKMFLLINDIIELLSIQAQSYEQCPTTIWTKLVIL